MLSNTVLVFILRFGSKLFLARILTPDDFGVFFYFLAIESIFFIFVEGGAETLFIQKSGVNRRQVTNYLNVISIGLFIVLAAFVFLQMQFTVNRVNDILWILFISLGLKRLAILPFAKLKIDLRFSRIAKIELIAAFISVIASLAASWYLKNFWGLVLGYLLYDVVKLLLLIKDVKMEKIILSKKMLFDFFASLGQGKFLLGARILNQLTTKSDDILIKSFFGDKILGFYSQAWNIMLLPVSQINSSLNEVSFPQYTNTALDDDRMKLYVNTLNIALYLSLPILIAFHFYATEIIVLLLGPQWVEAGPILGILAILGMFRALGNPGGPLLLAANENRFYFLFNVAMFIVSIIVFCFTIIILKSLDIFLLSYVVVTAIFSLFFMWKVNQVLQASLSDYRPLVKTLLLNAMLFVGFYFVVEMIGKENWILQAILGGGIYLLILWFMIVGKRNNVSKVENQ